MAEFGTSRALHNGSLTATTIGAAPGGPFPVRNAAPIVVPMARHGYTLHYSHFHHHAFAAEEPVAT